MARGGKRPGAGRPKGSRTKYAGRPFNDLVEIMAAVDRGLPGATLGARAVVALRVLGAEPLEIAAVLQLKLKEFAEFFREELELADIHRKCAFLHGLDAAAAGRGRKPSVPAMIYLVRLLDRAAGIPSGRRQ